MKRVQCAHRGGPFNGRTVELPATAYSDYTRPKKTRVVAKAAAAKGMFGHYVLDDCSTSEPFLYVWRSTK